MSYESFENVEVCLPSFTTKDGHFFEDCRVYVSGRIVPPERLVGFRGDIEIEEVTSSTGRSIERLLKAGEDACHNFWLSIKGDVSEKLRGGLG